MSKQVAEVVSMDTGIAACGFALALVFFGSFCAPPLSAQRSPAAADARYEAGQTALLREDYYAAVSLLLECVEANPSHAAGTLALAEAYYELGEYEEALRWARKARALARGSLDAANLEAFILAALGRLDEAGAVVEESLKKEPNNKLALFAAAEIDIAKGRLSDAVTRYKGAQKRFPEDRRLLLSLALVTGSLGDYEAARSYASRAQTLHSGDWRVFYYSAYIDAKAGLLQSALAAASYAYLLEPDNARVQDLLSRLRFSNGEYTEAARLADLALSRKTLTEEERQAAFLLKASALSSLGDRPAAREALETAVNTSLSGGDEFVRAALESYIMEETPLEDLARKRLSDAHIAKARDYQRRSLFDQALFEYRRGLRLYPYSKARLDYADLLKRQGFRERCLAEYQVVKEMAIAGEDGKEAKKVDEYIESLNAELGTTLAKKHAIRDDETTHLWKVAVFALPGQIDFFHADSGLLAANWIKDLLLHERSLETVGLPVRQMSFQAAFREARAAQAPPDYFLVISASEGALNRELSLSAVLYVTRTGREAARFTTYRTGEERLRSAGRDIAGQLAASLPFRGSLLRRSGGEALIDRGRVDGVTPGAVYLVIKKDSCQTQDDSPGLAVKEADIIGRFSVTQLGEEAAAGTLTREGFYDRVTVGDEVIPQESVLKPESAAPPKKGAAPPPAPPSQPAEQELRDMLRRLHTPPG